MPTTVADLTAEAQAFLAERHLVTLTTLRADGTPHVTPVGCTWDAQAGVIRVICSGTSQKARNARRTGRAAVCQVDGRRWLTLEGPAAVHDDPAAVADAERRYAERYQTPRVNPRRVVLVITVDRVLGTAALRGDR
jgi:PPOX class probable F420-dependent enzyme